MALIDADVLIVGGGLAGLCAAISSSSNLSETVLVTKTLVGGANTTSVAAGVTSAVTQFKEAGDSNEKYFLDTLAGGNRINDKTLVRTMVNDITKYLDLLLKLGVEFEGGMTPRPRFIPGHSIPRSYVVKGLGVRVQGILKKYAEALGVKFMERALITSLVKQGERVVGAVGCKTDTNEAVAIRANAVILATGGPGELYPRTLMPFGSSGYGTSLGLRAGAEVVDMEFIQFYPIMPFEEGLPRVFLDYALLMKYGAFIENHEGQNIFKKHKIDEPFKLTRDAFSILMAKEMFVGGAERPVYMDCTPISDKDIKEDKHLADAIVGLESKKIPLRDRKFSVSPYAHFFMGGLSTDPDGSATLPGLYSAGEAAGGVQGANRIGGNAFSACIVFGFRSGMAASLFASTVDKAAEEMFVEPSSWVTEAINFNGGEKEASEARSDVQRIMWEGVGIIRDGKGLRWANESLNAMRGFTLKSPVPAERFLIPMMLDAADVITLSAMLREESRGAQCRSDFPDQSGEFDKKIALKLCQNKCEVRFVTP